MRKFFAVTAIIISSQVQAQDSTGTLDQVTLTATKYSIKTTETGKVVMVINRQDIEKAGSRDLAQVITELGGVFINGYNSNVGKEKNIYLRGARVDYTLITIDGVPVYDATGIGSNFDIRNLSVDMVERIEILKGSQSTLYGSDAIAGVINIITRKGGTRPFSANATAHYGSYQTLRTHASVQGALKNFDYNVGYARTSSDGFSEAARSPNSTAAYDRDGYTQHAIQGNFGIQAGASLRIQPFIRYGLFKGDLDQDAFTDAQDFTNKTGNLQAGVRNVLQAGKAQINILYQFVRTQRDYLDDMQHVSCFYAFDDR